MTSAAEIFAKGGLARKSVEIEALGVSVDIVEMTLAQRGEMMALVEAGKPAEVGPFAVASCVPVMFEKTPEDIVNSLSPAVIEQIASAVFDLSGLGEGDSKN